MSKIEELYERFLRSSGVSIDSRSINTNEIFFAIKGENHDGNKFNTSAIKSGALLIVTDQSSEKNKLGEKAFLVDDTLSALQSLSHHHRINLPTTIIALTGSNGKTTSKELLYTCFATKYSCFATQGNYNNHIGVPLTLLKLNKSHQFGIIEMGANHVGEIDFLCSLVKPDYGFITNIGKAHMEGFGGIEGIKKGKSELYRHLTKNNKTIFYDWSDQILSTLLPPNASAIPYDSKEYVVVEEEPYISIQYKDTLIKTNLTGLYNKYNIASTHFISKYFDISDKDIIKAISNYRPTNNRSQLIKWNSNSLILDAYNANPSSMRLGIENAAKLANQNLILILGDMLELGEYSMDEHRSICELVTSISPLSVYYIGTEFQKLKEEFDGYFFPSTDHFKNTIDISIWENKCILLKGSRGIGLERIID